MPLRLGGRRWEGNKSVIKHRAIAPFGPWRNNCRPGAASWRRPDVESQRVTLLSFAVREGKVAKYCLLYIIFIPDTPSAVVGVADLLVQEGALLTAPV